MELAIGREGLASRDSGVKAVGESEAGVRLGVLGRSSVRAVIVGAGRGVLIILGVILIVALVELTSGGFELEETVHWVRGRERFCGNKKWINRGWGVEGWARCNYIIEHRGVQAEAAE